MTFPLTDAQAHVILLVVLALFVIGLVGYTFYLEARGD